jgi:hypothetical protein
MPRPGRAQVESTARRAGNRCEYCRFPQGMSRLPFHCDHVIAEKHGGLTAESNLAWACFRCNMHKGPNIAGLDPVSGTVTRLFHPRQDVWEEHFQWNAAWLRGRTAVGRVTIIVLEINDADVVAVRESFLAEGLSFENHGT